MGRFVSSVALLVVACATATAQTPSSPPASGEVVTLTGCVQKGDDPNMFKLTNTAEKAGVATKTVEAVKSDWDLIGAPASVKLSEHVGHKVTVTGTKATTTEAEKILGDKSKASAMGRYLKVSDIKHVAPTCP